MDVFNNIPFAAPPIGDLRWTPPRPAAAWQGVRDATAIGPACPQDQPPAERGAAGAILGPLTPLKIAEDCLNLNVSRPAGTKAGARLPVMLWIYGGGFLFGGNSRETFHGDELTKRGVILVIPNYRLGALGFLAHAELTAESPHRSSGNYGLLDIVAALRWVRQNIAAFGGDPGNVTVFGESAGAAAVGLLAGSPETAGLFNRGISESGFFFGPVKAGAPKAGTENVMLAKAEQAGADYLRRLGVGTIAEARRVPIEKLIASSRYVPGAPPSSFQPIVDGWLLPRPSLTLLKEGAYDNRPMIVGYNNDEGMLFLPGPLTVAQYHGAVQRQWGGGAQEVLAAYPADDDKAALRALRDIRRDAGFGVPAWRWAMNEKGNKVFVYNFDRRAPFRDEKSFADVKAPHGGELPYVFGTLTSPDIAWNESDRLVSSNMLDYWTNFAKTGDPNSRGLPAWKPAAPGGFVMHFTDHGATPGSLTNASQVGLLDRLMGS